VSMPQSQAKQNEQPSVPMTVEVDQAAWLNLLLESEQRKDQLQKIKAEVAAMKSAHQTMTDQYQAEYTRKNKEIIAARDEATRHRNELIVTARALQQLADVVGLLGEQCIPDRFLGAVRQRRAEAMELIAILKQKNLL
jgi:hypothetical protein